jgi:hypothetical protein
MMKNCCDLHTHSIYSDGTWTPAQIIDEAEKIGEGTHERFIIDAVKFQKKTDSKTQQ